MPYPITAGRPAPLGATFDGAGVNFAVFSAHATRMVLCLFTDDGREIGRIDLPERDGDVWHGHIAGLRPGHCYGYRAHGPYAPQDGHRFNANKLLVDPYARALTGHPVWHDALYGYDPVKGPDSFSTLDSAPYMPRSVVVDPAFSWGDDRPPEVPIEDSVIYEAHVKGLTRLHPGAAPKGKFLGLASEPMLDHLTKLGVTAVELLPIHAFVDDKFLHDKGLTNYWGYQSLGFFAPDPRYLTGGDIAEFQQMVARLHGAGIEVILDVVYNHTCEGDENGPTLSLRGIDNASYYRLAPDKRHYINDTGTGNTVNVDHPMVLRMIMDSLRYWVEVGHVDGFRFDLCATLGRTPTGFDPGASFFDAIRQDPVLTRVKLIAEPWDIGPGGYQLGAFPPPFLEWNDRFRDTVRQFWRGDPGLTPRLADRITGSARQFDHSGRPATSSVNLLTAHDGFTLTDVVSYTERHNEANGEAGRDGHAANWSDNMGVEGPTADAAIIAARDRRKRAMLATLMLSQGTPMLLAGDEIGNSQSGNNNAYAQDNEIGWIDWTAPDADFLAFAAALIAFRRAHPILRQKRFLHASERTVDGLPDLFWWHEDGREMTDDDWADQDRRILCVEKRMAAGTPRYATEAGGMFLIFNAGRDTQVALPPAPGGKRWILRIDTTATPAATATPLEGRIACPAEAVLALVLEPAP
ncbi:glycogen debranching protein GlgX [Roseicyclus mahoneyensis]|uniref:Glycogen operon protein n=1 Tax=Roseicyclus mahoneyensis TaxID=164332 RepID=A0A316GZN3_9RHOB|nr:glycogen debranching protein GlgX [Roseicyclus mahoneyensis]PWK60609.1 glycogen operon protein [Roseicyclus mahoneyensis]